MNDRLDSPTLRELFLEALELEPSEWSAFLDERCAGQPFLRSELQSLLDSHAAPGLLPEMEEERPFGGSFPERLGNYRIVRPLGEGGMGTVFLAIREGPGFEQTVALKVISGSFPDPLLARRLEEERRILALLEHPGIARLVDGGVTQDGQPFFAMEFVSGEEILANCDTRRLSLEDRIRLFVQVCDAVHYAHQQLVVHRDLKPSNILVTRDGRPKLLDFGIAKNLETVAAPEMTTKWVTPAYASPEQIGGGGVSTLSDVYSLGVLLCEALTGSRPFDRQARSPADLIRVIQEESPRPPSGMLSKLDPETANRVAGNRGTTPTRLARMLRGDLDMIVLRALAKEPGRRYDSARALADDLRRYLDGRPIRARRDSRVYRVTKFVRRHSALSGAVALLFLTMVVGVGGVLWQAGRAASARDQAEVEASRARQVTALMTDIFRLGDPTTALGDTIGVRQVLQEGVARVEQTLTGEPALQANLLLELARVFRNLGILDEAERLGRRAVSLRQEVAPGSLSHAEAQGFLGLVYREAGRQESAIDYLQRAIELRQTLLSEPDTALATLWAGLGWELRARGEQDQAVELFGKSLEVQLRLLGPESPAVASTTLGLASSLHDQGQFDEAEVLLREVLERSLEGGASPVASAMSLNLGSLRRLREQYREAEELLRQGLEIGSALYGPDHPEVIDARHELGVALVALGRFQEAEPLLAQSLEGAIRVLGEGHENTRSAREAMATLEHELGRFEKAAARLDTVVAAKARAHGGDHPGVVYSLIFQGDILLDGGHPELAEDRYGEALAMGGRLGGNEGVYGALARHGLARAALAGERMGAADSLLGLALSLAGNTLREDHRYVLQMLRTRARIHLARGEGEPADTLLRGILEAEERVRPRPHPRIGKTLSLLGEALRMRGRIDEAQEVLVDAGQNFSELPEEHPYRIGLEALLRETAGPRSRSP